MKPQLAQMGAVQIMRPEPLPRYPSYEENKRPPLPIPSGGPARRPNYHKSPMGSGKKAYPR